MRFECSLGSDKYVWLWVAKIDTAELFQLFQDHETCSAINFITSEKVNGINVTQKLLPFKSYIECVFWLFYSCIKQELCWKEEKLRLLTETKLQKVSNKFNIFGSQAKFKSHYEMDVCAQLNYYFQHFVDGEKRSRQEAFVSENLHLHVCRKRYFRNELRNIGISKAHKSS